MTKTAVRPGALLHTNGSAGIVPVEAVYYEYAVRVWRVGFRLDGKLVGCLALLTDGHLEEVEREYVHRRMRGQL